MRVVVTGAAGFVGSAVALRLLNDGHEILGVDNLSAGLYSQEVKLHRLRRLSDFDRFTLLQQDVYTLDWRDVLSNVDAVVNEAAMPGLRYSWENFDAYLHSNVRAFEQLLKGLKVNPNVYLVHASTSSVYGEWAVGSEDLPLNPVSPYGVTKMTSELLIRAYLDKRARRYTILRYFSVYGPGQRPDMAYARFCKAMTEGRTFKVNGDGRQSRTNTFIDDVADATVRALSRQRLGLTCNISGSSEISLMHALSILADEMGVSPKFVHMENQRGDQRKTAGDSLLARKELGWHPTTSIDKGLRLQARHFRKHGV